eukprot:2650952-Prymnesium_polylepis.1
MSDLAGASPPAPPAARGSRNRMAKGSFDIRHLHWRQSVMSVTLTAGLSFTRRARDCCTCRP